MARVNTSINTTTNPQEVLLDITIIGGGIGGLWLLNRLRNAGYNAILLESKQLGSQQTVASQGMIHGGIKYALSGSLTHAAQTIAAMPDHWRRCLAGTGDVDLRQAKLLSNHFYLWSSDSIGSKIKTFFASKATRGRVSPVDRTAYPPIFNTDQFKGSLYQLQDLVLDIPTVIAALQNNCREWIYKVDASACHFICNAQGGVDHLAINSTADSFADSYKLKSQLFVFAAGEGNEALLNSLAITYPQMQRRPLHQVMLKQKQLPLLFGHCMGASADANPRLTISSYKTDDGATIWYLGGDLAWDGVGLAKEALIAHAKAELKEIFPWIDFSQAEWDTYLINRAEPKQKALIRPDKAFAEFCAGHDNLMTVWPTKLSLAPSLANEILQMIAQRGVTKSSQQGPLDLAAPTIAFSPWELAFNNTPSPTTP